MSYITKPRKKGRAYKFFVFWSFCMVWGCGELEGEWNKYGPQSKSKWATKTFVTFVACYHMSIFFYYARLCVLTNYLLSKSDTPLLEKVVIPTLIRDKSLSLVLLTLRLFVSKFMSLFHLFLAAEQILH